MHAHAFGDLVAHTHHRIERRHRLLEDHRNLVAADAPHLRFAITHGIAAPIENFAADNAASTLVEQPDDRKRGHALAAAGLADQPDRLAVRNVETDAVDGTDLAVAGEERGVQILDAQQRRVAQALAGTFDHEGLIATIHALRHARKPRDRRRWSCPPGCP